MIIKECWERSNNLYNILKVIKENIDDEFSEKVEKMFCEYVEKPFDKSSLLRDCTKEEIADMLFDIYDLESRKTKMIHVLLNECERLENKN